MLSKILPSIFAFPRFAGEGSAQRRMRASFRRANENFTHTAPVCAKGSAPRPVCVTRNFSAKFTIILL
jgi:hypothetical protein